MAAGTKLRKTVKSRKKKKDKSAAPVMVTAPETVEGTPEVSAVREEDLRPAIFQDLDEEKEPITQTSEVEKEEEIEMVTTAPEPAPAPVQSSKETREVLVNPFKVGDKVSIPAGTTYTSSNPALKGRNKTGRAQTVTVLDSFPSFLTRTKSGRILARPFRIRTTGSGGYWKDITITEKIIRMNGLTPEYEEVEVTD